MVGDEGLGESPVVGGSAVSVAQHRRRTLPDTPYTLPNGNKGTYDGHSVDGMVGDEGLGEAPMVGGSAVSVAQYRRRY